MVLIVAVREYMLKMLTEIKGMKVLLLDDDTVGFISVAFSQSELLHKEVLLVAKLDSLLPPPTTKSGQPLAGRHAAGVEEWMSPLTNATRHLKAVCCIRPTDHNFNSLRRLLSHREFSEMHIYFSNMVNDLQLHILAEADVHELVQTVQEFFFDFYAVDAFHFTLHLHSGRFCYSSSPPPAASNGTSPSPDPVMGFEGSRGWEKIVQRSVEGILSVFLATKRRPVVRYAKKSEIVKKIAEEAARVMYEEEKPLFDFRKTDAAPLLLIIPRADDPVTPLLSQWTYQAMVHELIGIDNNRVDLRNVPGISEEIKEVVLSAEQDLFFRSNMFENFGEVGGNVARMVEELQQKHHRNQKMQTIEDMVQVLEAYPEYRQQAGAIAKHVTIMSELQRIISARRLLPVSQMEQELACGTGQAAAFEGVVRLVEDEKVSEGDALRLVMLYSLRYEKEAPRQIDDLVQRLVRRLACSHGDGEQRLSNSHGQKHWDPKLVQTLLRCCGAEKRNGDLFGNKDIFNLVARNVKRGLAGVENIYTQHQPLLVQTAELASKGKLRESEYPFVSSLFQQSRPSALIIFIVGGSTYEEARAAAHHNSTCGPNGMKIIVGGTSLLTSNMFLSDLAEEQASG